MKAPLLVLGATGLIGRGVVDAALAASRPVIAVARDPAKLAQLQALHADADLRVIARSIGSDAGAAQLVKLLRQSQPALGGVVAALGGGDGRGCLLTQPLSSLRQALEANLLPHLAAARHLLPLLAEAPRADGYLLIGGPGSEMPWAAYGPQSVSAAALRMLACALHNEARALGVRLQLLAVDAPARAEHNRVHACSRWPTPREIGQRALELIERRSAGEAAEPVVHFVTRRGEAIPSPPRSGADPPIAAASTNDRPLDDNEGRCLDDARALLRSLTSPRNDETSP